MGKGRKSGPRLLQAQLVEFYLFGVTNGERGERVLLAVSTGLCSPGIWDQRSITNERAKNNKNSAHTEARQALVCLWSISAKLQC